ncbi:MAG: protein translocase subunit SecD [Candidatus Spechtbacterales bacterium]|nr:protein translocase subunit SecD [Candidatus Spechtbacterales bacterium]
MFKKLFPKSQKAKIRWVVFLILIATIIAANFDFPRYWNRGAEWTNTKLDSITAPAFLLEQDDWGIIRWIDDNVAHIPLFPEKEYSLGLDLQGGIHLVYEADLSDVQPGLKGEAMSSLRDVLERRVNFLGVSEPVVQVERSEGSDRLIIELAGVEDPEEAIKEIGETPHLEFKEPRAEEEQIRIIQKAFPEQAAEGLLGTGPSQNYCNPPDPQMISFVQQIAEEDPCFADTELNGQYLERATVQTDPTTGQLQVSLEFDEEGSKLFEEITERNLGSTVAIYLDGRPVSMPTVNQKITGGQAVITGSFTPDEARNLARNLNAGALPVPITIISQQRVGASLGEQSLYESLEAGVLALIVVMVFLVIIYRFSGLLAVLSLLVYISLLLALIKLIPITLTLAGIAGLILSIGMAVDANILIFERLREEFKDGVESTHLAVERAFDRAWPSIRDGNISTLLTAAILFWFSTSFVQGFALTLGFGVAVSLFSAMVVTKYFMKIFLIKPLEKRKWLWTR